MNPSARSERSKGLKERIKELSPRVEIFETEGKGHARELAKDFVTEGVPKIVVAGGDGTINEAVNGMAEAGSANATLLGLLPTGTMNVFATELGIPPTLRIKRCWEIIESDISQMVDLWKANDHHFIQLAGVGLDAQIIKETTWKLKKVLGPLSYLMSAAKVLSKEDLPKVMVRHPEGADVEGVIVILGNGQRYGGPFKIFRDASICDGLLDVLVLKDPNYPDILEFIAAAAITGYANCQEIEYFQTAELTIEQSGGSPVAVEVDGDFLGETPVTFSRARSGIRVLAPAPSNYLKNLSVMG